MFSAEETQNILDDAQRIGASIGWSDRGVSLPTQDVLVQNLSKESQELVHRAIRAAIRGRAGGGVEKHVSCV